MKKAFLFFFVAISLSLPAFAGTGSGTNTSPVMEQESAQLAKKKAKMEKLQTKLQKKLEKKVSKKKKAKGPQNLRLSRVAKKLAIIGLIGAIGFSLIGLLVPFVSLLAYIFGLGVTVGGIMGLVLWIIEKGEENPDPEVLKNSKTAALIWGITVIATILAYIGLIVLAFLLAG